eukprot:CAMPEP_0198726166 /NCGR_PEP_ID=MMETSP1475-20131203/3312_1 /TAXON_ID= ORGANISM="Unidentified sp., Strain CCMP1999" /NCGR_SAMPLE_ID=MMETSP1475 /ASSEMBLY_ACC=CAM_ASM_001111 /LENGTH=315 /DNA_ID=CAMNT_0044488063 /DNA_START=12 /DNA_END=958 /DNA_ORIENTATION=+
MAEKPVDYCTLFESVLSRQEKDLFGGVPMQVIPVKQLRQKLRKDLEEQANERALSPPSSPSGGSKQAGTGFPRCETCNIRVSGIAQMTAHLAGKQHLKNLRRRTQVAEGSATPQDAAAQASTGLNGSEKRSGDSQPVTSVENESMEVVDKDQPTKVSNLVDETYCAALRGDVHEQGYSRATSSREKAHDENNTRRVSGWTRNILVRRVQRESPLQASLRGTHAGKATSKSSLTSVALVHHSAGWCSGGEVAGAFNNIALPAGYLSFAFLAACENLTLKACWRDITIEANCLAQRGQREEACRGRGLLICCTGMVL